ncbi:MAG: hypothetical protein ACKV22_32190 [Bryobacteraceae bacterium]
MSSRFTFRYHEGLQQSIVLFILGSLLSACSPDGVKVTAIIGGNLVRGDGSTVAESVVLVDRGTVRSAGSRVHVPIPAHSEKIDAAGRFVVAVRNQDGRIAFTPAVTLEAGSPADLAVVAGDPRQGRPQIHRLMLNGQWTGVTQASSDVK